MLTFRVRIDESLMARAQALLASKKRKVRAHRASVGIHAEDGTKPKIEARKMKGLSAMFGIDMETEYNYEEGVQSLAEVMWLHEFGAGVPERSFLRQWFDTNTSRLAEGMKCAMVAELHGDKDAVRKWVTTTHAEWKAWISDAPFQALSSERVRVKTEAGMPHPSKPLIATEQFINAWRAKLDRVPV